MRVALMLLLTLPCCGCIQFLVSRDSDSGTSGVTWSSFMARAPKMKLESLNEEDMLMEMVRYVKIGMPTEQAERILRANGFVDSFEPGGFITSRWSEEFEALGVKEAKLGVRSKFTRGLQDPPDVHPVIAFFPRPRDTDLQRIELELYVLDGKIANVRLRCDGEEHKRDSSADNVGVWWPPRNPSQSVIIQEYERAISRSSGPSLSHND